MCGIAGFWGSFGREALAAMTAAVAHRGPDDEGLELVETPELGGAVGLGHRRLSIIDLSTGHQHMLHWWLDQHREGMVLSFAVNPVFPLVSRGVLSEKLFYRLNMITLSVDEQPSRQPAAIAGRH